MKTTNEVVNEISVPAAGSEQEESNIRPHAILSEESLGSRATVPSPAAIIPGSDQTRIQRGKRVGIKELTNKINCINFQDTTVWINFKHPQYDQIISLDARPQPCLGEELECRWMRINGVHRKLPAYRFQSLVIPDGKRLLVVEPELLSLSDEGIRLRLPENSHEVSLRKTARYPCRGIRVQATQNSAVFEGLLLDFNAISFRVELTAVDPQTFDWIHPEHAIHLVIAAGGDVLYSGVCEIIRQSGDYSIGIFVLAPLKQKISRFERKEFRSHRQVLTPSPDIIFKHPFTGRRIELKVLDSSGAGFSVTEDRDASVLLPGMILPELELLFANGHRLKCRAQVIYRQELEDTPWVKCGLALLDMDGRDHVHLMAVLHQAQNPNTYLCNDIDVDALWDFFFEAGFIYPEKYVHIQKNKTEIKATYEKLYNLDSQIARHFIYQERGHILGHMSMLRFYANSWLIQHHAAKTSAGHKAGLMVLDQIGRMVTESHRLHSLHMKYIMCYYRPDNKFPRRVFGGAEHAIDDPRGCSIDCFAYMQFKPIQNDSGTSLNGWELTNTQPEDLSELAGFYAGGHDGLMLNALDLQPNQGAYDELFREYFRLGLKRVRQLLSLKDGDRLKAIVAINLSDFGLNLSDLTNCIKIFALDPDVFRRDRFESLLSMVCSRIGVEEIPVMLYPLIFVDEQRLPYDKLYNLWICSLQYSDPYLRYLKRLLRFI